MSDIYIGIDPGQKGGLSGITLESVVFFRSMKMPLLENKKDIDSDSIYQLFKGLIWCEASIFVAIEKSQPMPGQGVVSVFNYGKGYGKILGIIECLKIPYQEISPQKWKKEFNLIKKTKKDSVVVAKKLFPNVTFKTKRGRLLDGVAESLLIAEWARRGQL